MRESMVTSQFETLEHPAGEDGVAVVSIDCTIDELVSRSVVALGELA